MSHILVLRPQQVCAHRQVNTVRHIALAYSPGGGRFSRLGAAVEHGVPGCDCTTGVCRKSKPLCCAAVLVLSVSPAEEARYAQQPPPSAAPQPAESTGALLPLLLLLSSLLLLPPLMLSSTCTRCITSVPPQPTQAMPGLWCNLLSWPGRPAAWTRCPNVLRSLVGCGASLMGEMHLTCRARSSWTSVATLARRAAPGTEAVLASRIAETKRHRPPIHMAWWPLGGVIQRPQASAPSQGRPAPCASPCRGLSARRRLLYTEQR